MLKENYKKIAYKQCNVEFNDSNKSLSIPFVVNFVPTRILVRITGMTDTTLDSKFDTKLWTGNSTDFICRGSDIKYDANSKQVKIDINNVGFNPMYRFYIKEITLIE